MDTSTSNHKFTKKLSGARVLVVGGSSGVGYAVAEGCIEFGSTVHIASSNPQRVEKAVQSLKASYPSADGRIHGHVCALNDRETLENNIVDLLNKTGELDHIVHTAGDLVAPPSTPDGKVGLFASTVDSTVQLGMVRFFSVQMLAKHAVDFMPRRPSSSITITTGQQSERPNPGDGWAVGIATGILGMARGFAIDLAPIRVNAVSLGTVMTPLRMRLPPAQREKIEAAMTARALTGRLAQPEDPAEAYLYLMRDSSCTGAFIRTDSGSVIN